MVTETSIEEWLKIILPGYVVPPESIGPLANQCANVYDLDAVSGYEKTYMQALYIAANQYYAIAGTTSMNGPLVSRKEGDISETYGKASGSTTKSGPAWKTTPQGQEFISIIRVSQGGCGFVAHAG